MRRMAALPAHVQVAIVGAGFGGIAAAVRLVQAGVRDVVLLERGDEVGGTWRDNRYPGCACDVQSHLYSLSFAPNPDWSRTYSPQPEIQAYARRVADDFGVRERLHLHTTVLGAAWDGATQRWQLRTSRGALTAAVLVLAQGALSEPAMPDIPGLDDFRGPVFHSARWRDDVALEGRRVAVIGTGASAIQFVPAIQPRVAALDVYQRTPPWVMPRHDRAITAVERAIYRRLPVAQRLVRARIYAWRELLALPFQHPRLARLVQHIALAHLRAQVADPALRARLVPDYVIGCKRILLSNDWYPALARPNVQVVNDPIARVRPEGIETRDGTVRPADVLIVGTGFRPTAPPLADAVHGRAGTTLAAAWQGSPVAHLGTTVHGFPNLFMLMGPNTGLGHSSVLYMLEAQVAHLVGALRHCARHGIAAIEPTRAAQAAWRDDVARRERGTVWTSGGCASWYLDRTGRNSTLWPDFTWRFRRRVAPFDASEYAVVAPTPAHDAPTLVTA